MKNIKSTLKKIIKGICFTAIFFVLLYFFQSILQAKWFVGGDDNTANTDCFSEYRNLKENSLDVLFVGTSHILYGVDPMYIYENSGICGYDLTGPGMRMDLAYLIVEDALKTQKPQVLFLDMSGIQFMDQQTEGKSHKVADQLPLTASKIEYAFNNGNEELDPLSVMFPFFRYHARWNDLQPEDYDYTFGRLEPSFVRGHHIDFKAVHAEFKFEKDKEGYELTDRNREYLDRIVEICEKNDVELVLMKIPNPTWRRVYSETAKQYADEKGVKYLEFYYELEEIGFDSDTDFKDKTDHLNQYGAEKFSEHLMKYIQANYTIEDKRGVYTDWDEDLVKYKSYYEQLEKEAVEESKK